VFHVTGVQTCALPIFARGTDRLVFRLELSDGKGAIEEVALDLGAGHIAQAFELLLGFHAFGRDLHIQQMSKLDDKLDDSTSVFRSEERRVAKASRARW